MNGAEIIFRPSEWNDPSSSEGLDWWKIQNQSRAVENHCCVGAVSSVAISDEMIYPGHSMIVDPYGRILLAATDCLGERILGCAVDVNEIRRIRQTWKTRNHLDESKLEIYAREYSRAAQRRRSEA